MGSNEAGKIENLTFVKDDLYSKDKSVPQINIDGKVFEQKEPPKPIPGGRGQSGGPGGLGGAASISGIFAITINAGLSDQRNI